MPDLEVGLTYHLPTDSIRLDIEVPRAGNLIGRVRKFFDDRKIIDQVGNVSSNLPSIGFLAQVVDRFDYHVSEGTISPNSWLIIPNEAI